jgi:hypothetical protein
MKSALQYLREILTLLGEDRRKLPALVVLFLGVSLLDLAGLGLIAPYIGLVMKPEALLDILGVASIMPFMVVLANPELVETNAILNTAFAASSHLGVDTPEQFLFALGIGVFVLLVGSLAFKALTTCAQLRFTLMREYSTGKRVL